MEEKKIVLVTGASGLIGQAVCKRLAQEYQVVGFDRVQPKEPGACAFIACDMGSRSSIEEAVKTLADKFGNQVASVIHLAAYYSFSGDLSPLYDQITVEGSRGLLRALREQGFRVGQFLFSSTMLVHAPTEPGKPISEESPLDPRWPYPESKVRAEKAILEEHDDIPVVILRIAGVYDDVGHSIPLGNQIARIYERQVTSHFFPGETRHGQSFVHLDDVVEAIRLCVERRESLPDWTTLLIGEPDVLSYSELQHQIAELLHGSDWSTVRVPALMAKAGAWAQGHLPVGREPFIKPWMIQYADDHYEVDITLARQLLGWQPKHRLEDSLPGIIDLLKHDPVAWYKRNKLEPPGRVMRATRRFRPARLGGVSIAAVAGAMALVTGVTLLRRSRADREVGGREAG